MREPRNALAFYLHVPFCASRCGYCDFNTYTASELGSDLATISRDTWADYAIREIARARVSAHLAGDDRPLTAVFFGGGTPTQVPATHLVRVLAELRSQFGFIDEVEVTTEANPDSVDATYLQNLRDGGFTRISFGHQSSASHVLRVLERTHTPGRTWEAIASAHAAGFEHINVDLIYATPGETDDDLRRTLDDVVAAPVDHVSAYSLIVESGTRLAAQVRRGEVPMPDDDIAALRYGIIDERLQAAGLNWYEVSNWATATGQCQHNLAYWRNHDWWGIGPGAHSHIAGHRWWNAKHPATWAAALTVEYSIIAGEEFIDVDDRRVETIMLGLRLREGLDVADIAPDRLAAAERWRNDGFLDSAAMLGGRLVLTDTGRLLADAIVRDLTS
jgi:oxygen-independent coproporphyrinogen-3 oxidase